MVKLFAITTLHGHACQIKHIIVNYTIKYNLLPNLSALQPDSVSPSALKIFLDNQLIGNIVCLIMKHNKTMDAILTSSILFLLSGAGLALEVTLTRLFSFIFTHSYVYIVISISMAGLGLGAVLMRLITHRIRTSLLPWIAPVPVVLGIMLLIIAHLQGGVLISICSAFLIFFALGMFQLTIFQESKIRSGALYAADLTGAAAGSVITFLLLNAAGAVTATIVTTTVISLACLLSVYRFYRKGLIAAGAVLLITASGFIFSSQVSLMPREALGKEMTLMLQDSDKSPEIIETRWTAFGRVDLVETDNPLFKTMFIDGAAGTKMISMSGGQVTRETAETLLYQYMGGVPLLAVDEEDKERALIVGSGGGIDVVTTLLAGYRAIDAVEINPDFIAVTEEYSEYNGGIYTDNLQVTVIEGEGRSFIRSSDTEYDLILMSLPITKSARNYGNQALAENYLFTYDAFEEYFQRLSPDGLLVLVTHYPNELLKIAVNAITALTNLGVAPQAALSRLIAIGPDTSPTLILKKSPFSAEETELYYTILDALSLRGTTNFIPGYEQQSQQISTVAGTRTVYEFNPGLHALSLGNAGIEDIVAANSENIAPVSDNSPFFYQMGKGLPYEIRVVVIIALILITAVMLLYTVRTRQVSSNNTVPYREALLQFFSFASIGFGYMFIEIAYLQKFIFYWQHQTLALAIVLSIILISSGFGSYFSYLCRTLRQFQILMLLLLAGLVAGVFYLDPLLQQTGSYSGAGKLLNSVLGVGSVFVLMGAPFPLLLQSSRELHRGSTGNYPWLLGINSLASLGGGVFSMAIALFSGYRLVQYLGIAAYGLLFLFLAIRNSRTGIKSQ